MATPRGRKLQVAAVLAAVPTFLLVMILALGAETTAATAQASLDLPTYDAIAAQVDDAAFADERAEAVVEETADDEAQDAEARADEPSGEAATRRPTRATGAKSKQFLTSLAPKKAARDRRSAKSRKASSKRAPEKQAEPKAEDDAKGTLVAMAVGASCTFAIDGSPRGSNSSVRATVTPGVHTVSCAPMSGASRSRTVNVKPGKASVAVFKF